MQITKLEMKLLKHKIHFGFKKKTGRYKILLTNFIGQFIIVLWEMNFAKNPCNTARRFDITI